MLKTNKDSIGNKLKYNVIQLKNFKVEILKYM